MMEWKKGGKSHWHVPNTYTSLDVNSKLSGYGTHLECVLPLFGKFWFEVSSRKKRDNNNRRAYICMREKWMSEKKMCPNGKNKKPFIRVFHTKWMPIAHSLSFFLSFLLSDLKSNRKSLNGSKIEQYQLKPVQTNSHVKSMSEPISTQQKKTHTTKRNEKKHIWMTWNSFDENPTKVIPYKHFSLSTQTFFECFIPLCWLSSHFLRRGKGKITDTHIQTPRKMKRALWESLKNRMLKCMYRTHRAQLFLHCVHS